MVGCPKFHPLKVLRFQGIGEAQVARNRNWSWDPRLAVGVLRIDPAGVMQLAAGSE